MAALVVVIAGSLAGTIYWALADQSRQAIQDEGMHFECQECRHAFVKLTRDMDARQLNTRPSELRVDCAKCGAGASAIACVRCPECGRFYVPASYSRPAEKRAGRARDICPGCQTDRDEWYRRYYRGR